MMVSIDIEVLKDLLLMAGRSDPYRAGYHWAVASVVDVRAIIENALKHEDGDHSKAEDAE